MQTSVTAKNLSAEKVEAALKNPFGFSMENSSEVRNAIADRLHEMIANLHSKKVK